MDAATGLFLAAIAISALGLMWEFWKVRAAEEEYADRLSNSAISSSDMLVGSAGSPADWESDPGNVTLIGLCRRDRILDGKKVAALWRVGPDGLREAACLGFECRIVVKDVHGGLIAAAGTLSRRDFVASVSRPVRYLNDTAWVEVSLGGGG